ncbi:MAG: thiamine diphosphokinase [Patescibacteria group bacterium]|jgi:thiamine pyrophosphokinase
MNLAFIGNGDYFSCRQQLKKYDLLIALDGGANHCCVMNISPHYIIGDNDSCTKNTAKFFNTVPRIILQNQTTSDLQKALCWCKKKFNKSLECIDLFCVTSTTRPDHAQAAIQALVHVPFIKKIYTGQHTIQCLHANDTVRLTKTKSNRISLIPYGKTAHVTLTGLAWSGNNLLLNATTHSGISNHITAKQASVQVNNGTVLLIR